MSSRKSAVAIMLAIGAQTIFFLTAPASLSQADGGVASSRQEHDTETNGQIKTVLESAESTGADTSEGQIPSISLTHDGTKYTFHFKRMTRREVIEQLLSDKKVDIRWIDTLFANELTEGRYVGSIDEILSRVLSQTNYIVAYDMTAIRPRMKRIVIHGPAARADNKESTRSTNFSSHVVEQDSEELRLETKSNESKSLRRKDARVATEGVVGVSSVDDLGKEFEK